jgi:hypothetical protein
MLYKLLLVGLSTIIVFISGNQILSNANQDTVLANNPAVATSQNQIVWQEINPVHNEAAQIGPLAITELPTMYSSAGNSMDQPNWFIEEGNSTWTESELEVVGQTLEQTIQALALVGLDGQEILQGYRFRRFHGEYADAVDGRLAIVDHQKAEIVLSDAAFKRHKGFNIYHELGHVVDYRLDRQLSHLFHLRAGTNQTATDWVTAEGYWLRDHGRYDREEATADAFALWVLAQGPDDFRPVFYGTPVTVDFEAIIWVIEEALYNAPVTISS